MILWLVRHPAVTVTPGVVTGQGEVPLTPGYEEWLAAVDRRVPSVPTVWSSPLSRCATVAQRLIARRQGSAVTLVEESRIQEISFGAWEGKQWDAIPSEEFKEWESNLVCYAPPGGENLLGFSVRVQAALSAVSQGRDGDEPVLWVTHGGVIRVVILNVLRAPLTEIAALQVDLGSISRIQIHGAVRRVLEVNGSAFVDESV